MSQRQMQNRALTSTRKERGWIRRKMDGHPWSVYSLVVIVTVYLIWSLLPVLVAFVFSFNDGRSRSFWQGFSIQWWSGPQSVFSDPVYFGAVTHSLLLACLAVLISVPLGVFLSVFLARWRGVGGRSVTFLATLPLVIPEIVLALALFFLITRLLNFIHLGTAAQVLGQVTYILPLVIVIVRGRLASITPDLEEAAMDLGSRPISAFTLVLIPLLQPAILASAVVAFAISIDDFVITQFLASGARSQTVPMLIYNTVRGSATPALNAAAVVIAVLTIAIAGFGYLLYKVLTRKDGFEVQ